MIISDVFVGSMILIYLLSHLNFSSPSCFWFKFLSFFMFKFSNEWWIPIASIVSWSSATEKLPLPLFLWHCSPRSENSYRPCNLSQSSTSYIISHDRGLLFLESFPSCVPLSIFPAVPSLGFSGLFLFRTMCFSSLPHHSSVILFSMYWFFLLVFSWTDGSTSPLCS